MADLEIEINSTFSILQQDLDAGTIAVGERGDRFVVFPVSAFTVDFQEVRPTNSWISNMYFDYADEIFLKYEPSHTYV